MFKTEISALHIDNDQGHEMSRWNTNLSLNEAFGTAGRITSYDIGFNGSYFDIKDRPDDEELTELGRGNPHLALEWKSPLLLSNDSRKIVIEPRAHLHSRFRQNRRYTQSGFRRFSSR